MAFDQTDAASDRFYTPEVQLPDPLPREPFALFRAWFDEAHDKRIQPNPNAMALATVDADGSPSARIVLCKILVEDPGYVVFFTNYASRKARAIEATGRAGAVLHWDPLDRQVRLEGPVVRSPEEESDAYFASRPLESRLGAVVSEQSRPLASRRELLDRLEARVRELGLDPGIPLGEQNHEIPRPSTWGGYRLWPEVVELWSAGPGRVHDRAVWTRRVAARAGTSECETGGWTTTRLQP